MFAISLAFVGYKVTRDEFFFFFFFGLPGGGECESGTARWVVCVGTAPECSLLTAARLLGGSGQISACCEPCLLCATFPGGDKLTKASERLAEALALATL